MKTKIPSAIIYGWDRVGTYELVSDIYYEENLFEKVIIYSLNDINNIIDDYNNFKPDVIMLVGNYIRLEYDFLQSKTVYYDKIHPDNIIANDIVVQSSINICKNFKPKFSIFTPTYKTGTKIYRTYESIKNQIFVDWEWVVVDDSPDNETWDILQDISNKDYRVKVHKIYPLTNGIVGLSKNRASSLCNGEWIVELDHDDELTDDCLYHSYNAIEKYPDAGFLYSDVCELYENGNMKYYDNDWSGNWYGRIDNIFDFGYAGHTWVEYKGKNYLQHHYPDINPLTIRFNVSMPNHVRMWKKLIYDKIGGHNKNLPVADDFELIVRTFLETKFIHVKKMLYLQWNNGNSTVDNNSIDINRRARTIRDYYDEKIHNRILGLGSKDWNWDENRGISQRYSNNITIKKFNKEEEILNYIYE
jgi:glycosyltransferase involved in cell wall biosynthesis